MFSPCSDHYSLGGNNNKHRCCRTGSFIQSRHKLTEAAQKKNNKNNAKTESTQPKYAYTYAHAQASACISYLRKKYNKHRKFIRRKWPYGIASLLCISIFFPISLCVRPQNENLHFA